MSDKLPNNNTTDEIDLGVLFNAIGRLFEKAYNFILNLFKLLFNFLISVLKIVIVNFKYIFLTFIVAAIAGYFLDKTKTPMYSSSMLVKPYFDSKYQLINSINYYNSLLEQADYATLSTIFTIPEEEAKSLMGFTVEPGPRSENENIKDYSNYIKSLDSTLTENNNISYEEYLENRNIFSNSLYNIKVYSNKKDVFAKLEDGLNSSFENKYSAREIKKRDSLIEIQKQSINNSIESLKELQNVYVNVLTEESKSGTNKISLGGEGFSIDQNKSNTREYELLNQEIKLKDQLRRLEEQKIEQDVIFDVVSSFQKTGEKEDNIYKKYKFIIPIVSLFLLVVIYLILSLVKFVKSYEPSK